MMTMAKNSQRVKLLPWEVGLYKPYRYKVAKGGCGSRKSFAVAEALLRISCTKPCLMLCGREFQNSIKESVHSLLEQRAEAIGLAHRFKFLETEIINKASGSRIFFMGLRHNIDSIKSMAGITHAWLEEANTISMQNWDTLRNTVRENDSEIFITFNPKKETDAVYQEFCRDTIPKNTYIKHTTILTFLRL
jgi:phage terminase large subunit